MKEHSIAVSVSLFFHLIIVVFFLRVPLDQYLKPKVILLDFSIQKGQVADDREALNHKSRIMNSESKAESRQSQQKGQPAHHRDSMVERAQSTLNNPVSEAPTVNQTGSDPVSSDPAGRMTVNGNISRAGTKVDAVTETGIGSGTISQIAVSSGSRKVLDYEDNGADERDFLFIRDMIVKRIKDRYPERARRMGREGRVLLSFDLSSDGVIRNVEIIRSSGSRILDDNAKEVVEKTTFSRKIPYARRVHLPVEYRLQ